jgi:DNA relaxase NicK
MSENTSEQKYYNEQVKKAINTYREKNREKYNEYCSEYLKKRLQDPEWAEHRRQKINEYNKAYQLRKRQEKIANGYVPKPRGRPRKNIAPPEEPMEDNLGKIKEDFLEIS